MGCLPPNASPVPLKDPPSDGPKIVLLKTLPFLQKHLATFSHAFALEKKVPPKRERMPGRFVPPPQPSKPTTCPVFVYF